MMRSLLALVVFSSLLSAQESLKPKDFPTKEEIKLVVAQAERALTEYKQAVELEASLPAANKDKASLDNDKQLIELYPKLLDGLTASPSKFNSLGGLLLLTTLDDAARNAALCSSSGMGDIGQELLSNRDTAAVYRMMAISQKCIDVSTHLYTVSESVNALFVRAIEAQEELNQQAMDTITKCAAALQKPKK